MDTKIKVGLASYGLSGQVFHAPFISRHDGFELKYIVERTSNLAAEQYPESITLRSFDELLETDVDLIVINTPTFLHHPMALAALEKGKHVVLEKPMASSLEKAQHLVQVAEAKNLRLAVYHNRRFEGGYKTLQRLIKENTLGDLTYYKAHFNRFKPTIGVKKWKEEAQFEGAGILFDLAPHLLDQAINLFGIPISIESELEKQRPNSEVIDYFFIQLIYPNSFIAELEAGLSTQSSEPKYILKGSKGTYTKQLEDHQEDSLRLNTYPSAIDPDSGILLLNNIETILENPQASYKEFYDNLHTVLSGENDLIITSKNALTAMELMDQVLRQNS